MLDVRFFDYFVSIILSNKIIEFALHALMYLNKEEINNKCIE